MTNCQILPNSASLIYFVYWVCNSHPIVKKKHFKIDNTIAYEHIRFYCVKLCERWSDEKFHYLNWPERRRRHRRLFLFIFFMKIYSEIENYFIAMKKSNQFTIFGNRTHYLLNEKLDKICIFQKSSQATASVNTRTRLNSISSFFLK